MEEYRKIIKVHPLLLFKEDLLELERMVINNFDCNRVKIEIAVTSDGHNIKTDSVVNLLENITQDYDADAFEFVAFGYNSEDKIIRSITLRMFHGYVDYQIAGDNEVWFLGIIKILNSFLKARKPKYSFF